MNKQTHDGNYEFIGPSGSYASAIIRFGIESIFSHKYTSITKPDNDQ